MTDALVAPALPESLEAAGWEQVDERTETVFEMAAIRIRGATRRSEDERTRDTLRAATGIDHPLRFLAATRLGFQPSLPPGVSPKLFAPTLRSQLRSAFADELEERGLVDVTHEGKDRQRLAAGSRVYLNEYTGTAPLDDHDGSLPLECWAALWISGGVVRILSGGFPAVVLADHFEVDEVEESLQQSPEAYREFFFEVLDDTADLAAE